MSFSREFDNIKKLDEKILETMSLFEKEKEGRIKVQEQEKASVSLSKEEEEKLNELLEEGLDEQLNEYVLKSPDRRRLIEIEMQLQRYQMDQSQGDQTTVPSSIK